MILSRLVKVQLAVFVCLALVGVLVTAVHYVGFFDSTYTVKAVFPDSGGIFTNASVLERGVQVGKVGALSLSRDGKTVVVDLVIGSKYRIPADASATVANLSAVGEQYVDLKPASDQGPYLRSGSTIPLGRTAVPIDDATLLLNLDKLVNSVSTRNLAVTVDELGRGFAETGGNLRRLISSGDQLVQAAQAALPATVQLLDDGKTALATQNATAAEFRTFAANMASFSGQLVASDPDIRRLFTTGAQGAAQMQDLLARNRATLPGLLGNLVTLGKIQQVRIPGLKTILNLYPINVGSGFFGAAGGYAHFGMVVNNTPPPCTQGYHFNTTRVQNRPQDWGGPADLNTDCLQPPQGPSSVRGARNAPHPQDGAGGGTGNTGPRAGSTSAQSGSTSSSQPNAQTSPGGAASPNAEAAPYDPLSGLLMAPNGQTYQLGDNGGQQQVLGSHSWQWLLLAPTG